MFRTWLLGFAFALSLHCATASAQLFNNFSEYGTLVNGFQDDFNGAIVNPAWQEFGPDAAANFQQTGGVMRMLPATGDPNKLLVNGPYPASGPQNVLALIRVTDAGTGGDFFRGGVGAGSSPQGINLLFRAGGTDSVAANHFGLLNDAVAWGPQTNPGSGGDTWAVGQWKWLRLVYDPAIDQAMAKIWDAGATPEPVAFDLTWNPADRLGLAGLVTNSGGNGTFEVDYFLLQSGGLPQIAIGAIPEPSSIILFGLVGAIALVFGARRTLLHPAVRSQKQQ